MSDNSNYILSDRNASLLKRYLLGGAAMGGGAALITSMINYMKHLNKSDSSVDDDTLYIYKKPKNEPTEKAAGVGGGLALAAAPIGAMGAYTLIRKGFSELRKRQAQKELDEAQNAFIETQGYKKVNKKKDSDSKKSKDESAEKSASEHKPMSLVETATSLPVAIPLLMALGSGVVGYKLLDKHFPAVKRTPKAPRKIEIIDKPSEDQDEYNTKVASVLNDLGEEDACEFLIRVVAMEKKANSDVRNLIAAVANQGATPIKNAVETAGYEGALNLVKGASAQPVHPFKEHIATCYLAKSARMRDLVGLTAAAEFATSHPDFFKAAASATEEQQEILYKIACILGRAIRMELSSEYDITPPAGDFTKKAYMEDMFGALADSAASKISNEDTTDTSGEEGDKDNINSPSRRKKKVKFVLNGKSSKRVLDDMPDQDIIDKILSPNRAA